ncbi:unnamed protein product [Rangifer tarandus platyrhynchus]|uniref:Uncharacterized protein n=2 Tax=Rangifer tarandus platyrhynchus TaxID=3082113 RepID=A0ACB0E375_RANTA|nr:unnamed protein product [Rangifer tarandus platyrhynchus]CAI9694921.1 unnamed protein product [Rangifer tarandus platyrhynchus]
MFNSVDLSCWLSRALVGDRPPRAAAGRLPKDKSFISSRIVCKDQHRQAGAAVKRNRAGTSLGEGAALTRHTVSTLGLPILGLREQKDLLRRIRSYRAPRKLQANSPE